MTTTELPEFMARPYPENAAHRNYVAHNAWFSTGADVFSLLRWVGVEQEHSLVDIGCGSLRVGRFLMVYLNPGNYCGIDPAKWLIDAAIKEEVSPGLVRLKKARFAYRDDWDASCFGQLFDWVLIGDVLVHADHAMMRTAMQRAHEVLKPGGSLIANYFVGNPHHVESGWLYPNVAPHLPECYLELKPPGFGYQELGEVTQTRWVRLIKES